MDRRQAELLLAKAAGGDQAAAEELAEHYDELPHGQDCAKRLHAAAECTCLKAEIQFVLDETWDDPS